MSYCAHCGKAMAADRDFCSVCGKARPGFRPPGKGSTSPLLVVLLVIAGGFVAIAGIGIVAAILIPNFTDALQKAKQKRTLADFTDIAVALEAYYGDHDSYPNVTDLAALAAALEPEYSADLPRTDGWQQPYRYGCRQDRLGGPCTDFRLVSAGRDAIFEQDDLFAYQAGELSAMDYDGDLVYGTAGRLRGPG